ncbi:hypothetical protein TRE132_11940 [Pseudomonas chlororaphis subsp. aurantiaca]|nr:hypothetical protein TRE132_11940 [Pseudomonas chlororaphis subsp. aurantiaca]
MNDNAVYQMYGVVLIAGKPRSYRGVGYLRR